MVWSMVQRLCHVYHCIYVIQQSMCKEKQIKHVELNKPHEIICYVISGEMV